MQPQTRWALQYIGYIINNTTGCYKKKNQDTTKNLTSKKNYIIGNRLVHVCTKIYTKNMVFRSKFLVYSDFDISSFDCVQMDEVARILSYKISELANRTGQEEPKKSVSQRTANGQEVGSVSDEAAKKSHLDD